MLLLKEDGWTTLSSRFVNSLIVLSKFIYIDDNSIFSTLSCNEFKAITEGPFSINENLDSHVSLIIFSASSYLFEIPDHH